MVTTTLVVTTIDVVGATVVGATVVAGAAVVVGADVAVVVVAGRVVAVVTGGAVVAAVAAVVDVAAATTSWTEEFRLTLAFAAGSCPVTMSAAPAPDGATPLSPAPVSDVIASARLPPT
ncbi:MAG TPA: hypothetical protein VHT97_08865, partial [Acidimicrobiales bacterium]|nr:hypothetical protein [Acidimicrobiales bacterium]